MIYDGRSVVEIKKIRKHVPILIPLFASGMTFFINVFLKSSLSETSYGKFAISIFIANSIFTLGVYGYDQVLNRVSKLNDSNKVVLDISTLKIGVGWLLICPLFSMLILNYFIKTDFTNIFSLIIILFVPLIISIASIFKLAGDIFKVNLILNTWKILFPFIIITCYFLDYDFIKHIWLILFLSIIFILFQPMIWREIPICIVNKKEKELNRRQSKLLFVSSLSLVGFVVFEILDRNILISLYDEKLFGNYFFIYILMMTPVSIVSSYFSVLKLKIYKNDFNLSIFYSDLVKLAVMVLLIVIVIVLFLLVLIEVGSSLVTSVDFILLILISTMCVIKGVYTLASIAYSVNCRTKTLFIISIQSIIFSFIFFYGVTQFYVFESYLIVVAIFVLLWFFRLVAYLIAIAKDQSNNECF